MNAADHDTSDDFSRTRWSMVQQLCTPHPDAARDALAALAPRYWYPVYTYVRRCGHAPEIAQDITRAFFQQVEVATRGAAVPAGLFRNWLLSRLNEFLAGDWRELTEGDPIVVAPSLDDLEGRSQRDHLTAGSPEQAYHRSFALEVLANGFKTLQTEARQTGHLDMYEALEPYLSHDPVPGQFEEMAGQLDVRPLVLVLALKRLRQRFRELVKSELADTVASAHELDSEQQTLFAILRTGDDA